jgi:hypothetical protein
MHHRLEPKDNKFSYKTFMFCLDLDELNMLVRKNLFISRNRFNLFSFRDRDHVQLSNTDKPARNIKANILAYVEQQGVDTSEIRRITLVTNLCTLGYQFNPVSFYYCYNRRNEPVCAVVEVCNTYREMKLYFLGKEALEGNGFSSRKTKNFYVSPFIDLDTDFHFNLQVPGEALKISINDYQQGKKFFLSTLTGKRKPLTNLSVLAYAFRFPFMTLQVITLIHWQALKLWIKKINYHKKDSCRELQQDVLRPHKSIAQ